MLHMMACMLDMMSCEIFCMSASLPLAFIAECTIYAGATAARRTTFDIASHTMMSKVYINLAGCAILQYISATLRRVLLILMVMRDAPHHPVVARPGHVHQASTGT